MLEAKADEDTSNSFFDASAKDPSKVLDCDLYDDKSFGSWQKAKRIATSLGIDFARVEQQFRADVKAVRDPSVGPETANAPTPPGM